MKIITILANPPTWFAVILSLALTSIGISLFFLIVHIKNLIF